MHFDALRIVSTLRITYTVCAVFRGGGWRRRCAFLPAFQAGAGYPKGQEAGHFRALRRLLGWGLGLTASWRFPFFRWCVGRRVCGHRGRAPLFSSLPRRRSPRKARRRRLVLALRGVRRCGIPRPVGGRSPRSPWQGGRFYFLPVWQRLPFRSAAGERQRPPCPHSDKSGGEGGTLRLACCTA